VKVQSRKYIAAILSLLMVCFTVAACGTLVDRARNKINDIICPTEETPYKSTWENPNWGREMNPFFLNGDAEYWDIEDLDPLRRSMVDSYIDDFFVYGSSEKCVYYWIEGVRADSEYICIYTTIYVEEFSGEEVESYSIASIIKTRRDPPTTDYVGVSSENISFEQAAREYYPGQIYENCSPVPAENHDVHVAMSK